MIKLGQEVEFTPLEGVKFSGCTEARDSAIGKVVYINKRHRWFSVEYSEDNLRTSFKFGDIGQNVFPC